MRWGWRCGSSPGTGSATWLPAGVGRIVCGSGAAPGDLLPGVELGAGGADARPQAKGDQPAKSPKDVYIHPLRPDWQRVLAGGPAGVSRPRPAQPGPRPQPDERFTALWQEILAAVVQVANEHDAAWMQRQRVLNTLLVVLFVFRLVFSPNRQGYALTLRTLSDLWAQCRDLDIPLPKPEPVSQASMHVPAARSMTVFRIHREILRHAPPDEPRTLWHGHRTFAVDGSKLNLPQPLLENGYRLPSDGSHVRACSAACSVCAPACRSTSTRPPRRRAPHWPCDPLARPRPLRCRRLRPRLLLLPPAAHPPRPRPARRLPPQSNANSVCEQFRRSGRRTASSPSSPPTAREQQPEAVWRPCRVRLVRYTAGDTDYLLATTLLDSRRYPVRALADLYHARWGVEELYKISKQYLEIERFHGRASAWSARSSAPISA